MDVSVQFKKGVLELCVLVLINRKDQYGYELAQAVSRHIEVAEGALYPLLRRLVNEGYCTTYLQESSEGPPRKYYRLTDSGVNYMEAMVKEWKAFVSNVTNLIEEGN
ncbi:MULTISPECIES: PadR family transcriptional regulator [Paenibacillus]|jgi:PadR family transcriptional regulator PadR|uniref:Transcriptional regulator, PadR-like family n=2 Tax=Paenibacillus lactis TaxID=228574 RepID=G4HBC6_9BACL|nr:PadR family transcriptional regulator [Paenibacillus lactis]EHB67235.1 transcriptional regulator, PadR-like family [Paenibacillus lactis 154]MBP1894490.1 PadR family transcriptional regulator PadR [Paenibacillus lactis]MCM3496132.1 PadR family transcriptional regulator [Paenibacillus lactis]GIO93417.1 PadR family transcriptional regulator [Paenibacillus lactis]HAF98660.1 PadR family transcriptional regulator [Paenibacillus lactis]